MTLSEALAELEALGTEQNRKVYRRHGVGDNQFGVSYANLAKLKKTIKLDHQLARRLWSTGNHDARVLATMIADPRQFDAKALDAWVKDLRDHVVADAFSKLVAASPLAPSRMELWRDSEEEWVGTVGWNLVAYLAMDGRLAESAIEPLLATIEREIHSRKNRVRHAMNGALIAIGMRDDALEAKVGEVARRVGVVRVDHGETGCKTPDVIEMVRKARAHRARMAARTGPTRPRSK